MARRRMQTEEEYRAELEAMEEPARFEPQPELLPADPRPVAAYAEQRPDLYNPPITDIIEVICVNCFRRILTRDPREDVCAECYYLLMDQITEMRAAGESQVTQGNRPWFHVP
jgi:hypothetical protein